MKNLRENLEGYVIEDNHGKLDVWVRPKGSKGNYQERVFSGNLYDTFVEECLDMDGTPFLLKIYEDGSCDLELDKENDTPGRISKSVSDLLDRLENQEKKLIEKARNNA